MSKKQAMWLLAAVIIARSSSFLFSKSCMAELQPFNLLGLRFSLAFILLLPLLGRRLRRLSRATLLRGLALGGIFFAVLTCELMGMRTTATSTTSLPENTAIVFVPLFEALLLKRRLHGDVLLAALIALAGIAMLTWGGDGLSMSGGELLCLLSAVLYAVGIIATDRLSRRDDPLLLGLLQVGFVGLLGLVSALIWESPRLPSATGGWAMLLLLAVVCTGFGFTLQPLAQRYTSSEQAGLFCALNPMCASILGVLFLQERLGRLGLLGAGLVLLSLFAPYLLRRVSVARRAAA